MKALVVFLGVVLGLAACVAVYLPFLQKKCPFCRKRIPRNTRRCSHCFAKLQE